MGFELELAVLSGNAVLGERRRATVVIRNLAAGWEIPGLKQVNFHDYRNETLFEGWFSELVLPEGPNTHLEVRRTGDRHESLTLTAEFAATEQVDLVGVGNLGVADFRRSGYGPVSAETGRHFTPATNRVEFLPGESVGRIPVPLVDTGVVNADFPTRRFLTARLGAPSGTLSTLLVIEDNERAPVFDVTYDPHRPRLQQLTGGGGFPPDSIPTSGRKVPVYRSIQELGMVDFRMEFVDPRQRCSPDRPREAGGPRRTR
jgi:hypothetical protein